MNHIVLGGGCFWCLEASYQLVKGVTAVANGYAGGSEHDPTYEQVSSGSTGHAEVVKVTYDESIISLDKILGIFWLIHDPTSLNRQGADIGPQYRSTILYENDDQLQVIESSLHEAQSTLDDPIVTEVLPLDHFYPAEDYHQNYFQNHPEQGYCQIVINPKLQKLRKTYAELLG